MTSRLFRRAVGFFALASLTTLRSIYPASDNPQLERAKTNAQNLAYTFIGSHAEILAGAKREGNCASSIR